MTKENSLEGVADGTVMTTANTAGSGDAASTIISNNAAASGALAYQAAAAHYGSMGGRITLAAGASYWRWDDTQATGRWVLRRTFVMQTPTSSTQALASIYSTGSLMAVAQVNTAGKVICSDSAGQVTASASGALTNGSVYLLELAVTEGTTTSNGRIEMKIILVSDGSTVFTYDSGATRNTGTAGANRARIGGGVSGLGWTYDDFDAIKFGQLASGWHGIPTVPLVVTGTMSPSGNPSTANTGVARTLTVSGTGGNGNPVSLDVDWGDGNAHDTDTLTVGTPKTFTRTPSVAGSKSAVITYSQAN